MQILLDTQTLLWFLADDERLGPTARTSIQTATGVACSSISMTEIVIKQMLGRLEAPDPLADAVTGSGIGWVEYDLHDAEALRALPELVRHDPFDRMLAAQATARQLTLYTADKVLLALGRSFIVDSRT